MNSLVSINMMSLEASSKTRIRILTKEKVQHLLWHEASARMDGFTQNYAESSCRIRMRTLPTRIHWNVTACKKWGSQINQKKQQNGSWIYQHCIYKYRRVLSEMRFAVIGKCLRQKGLDSEYPISSTGEASCSLLRKIANNGKGQSHVQTKWRLINLWTWSRTS